MKLSRILVISILVIFSVLSIGVAEDSSQWSLPENAIARIGKGYITDMAYSPNGKLLAVTTNIGIWLFDANSGEELALLTGYTNEDFKGFSGNASHYSTLSFSPDGKLLASPSWDGKVRVWDVLTRKLISTIKGYHRSALFSPDGKTLAIDKKLWDTHTFTETKSLTEDQTSMRALAFSPDGVILITNNGLWNLKTGKNESVPIWDTSYLNTLGFSPNGKTIVCRGKRSNTVVLWNTEVEKQITILSGNKRIVNSVAYSPDGNTIASSCSETICIWDAKTKQLITTVSRQGTRFNEVEYTPDGKTLAVARTNGKIQLFDAKTGQLKRTLIQSQAIYSLLPSPDGKMLATGALSDIILWDLHTRKPKTHLIGDTDSTTPALFSQDGKNLISISSSEDQTKLVSWNISTGKRHETFAQNVMDVSSRSLSPDGMTLAIKTSVQRVQFFSIIEKGIQLWDTTTGKLKKTLTTQTSEFTSMVFSPDSSTFVTGDNQGTIDLWDTATGQHKAVLTQDSGGTEALVFSQDGKVLASCSRDEARLWDMKTGSQLPITYRTSGHMPGFYALALSPDGTILASGSYDAEIRIWNTKTGLLMDTLIGHTGAIEELAFLSQQKNEINENNEINISIPSGKTLASRSRDDTVLLWEIKSYVETEASVKVTPDIIESPNVGEQVTVNLDIENVEKVSGYQLTLEFDSTAFRYTSSKNGNFLPSNTHLETFLEPSWAQSPNRIDIVAESPSKSANDGDGILASINFVVIDQKDSTLSLPKLRLEQLNGSLARPTVIGSTVFETHQKHNIPIDYSQMSLPDGAIERLGKGIVHDVKLSPDNMQLAIATSIGIWLYDANNGDELALLTPAMANQLSLFESITYSPHGNLLLSSSSDGTLSLWNSFTYQLVKTFKGGGKAVTFSPDGKLFACGSGIHIKVWDFHSGQVINTISRSGSTIAFLRFSPDGQMLASASLSDNIQLWNPHTGKHKITFDEEKHGYRTGGGVPRGPVLAFSPDGRFLASTAVDHNRRENQKIKVWDTGTGALQMTLASDQRGMRNPFVAVQFSADGSSVISGRQDGYLQKWNLKTGEDNMPFGEVEYGMFSLLPILPNHSTFVRQTKDDQIHLWDVETGRVQVTLTGYRYVPNSITMSPDGSTLAMLNIDEGLDFWDKYKNRIATFPLKTDEDDYWSPTTFAFSPDWKIIAAGAWRTIRLWDTTTEKYVATLTTDDSFRIENIEYSPDGRILAAHEMDHGRKIILWDTYTQEQIAILKGHIDRINAITFSPDGALLASCSGRWYENDNTIRLWNTKTGKQRTRINNILKTKQNHDSDTTPAIKNILQIKQKHNFAIISAVFSPDGKTIASIDANTDIELWDVKTGKHKATVYAKSETYYYHGQKYTIAFSPDGTTLATAVHGIDLWDVETGKLQKTLKGHSGIITSLQYSEDGTTLVSRSADGTALFWEMRQTPVTRLQITPRSVRCPPAGQQISFDIYMTAAQDVSGYQFLLEYDTKLLRFIPNTDNSIRNTEKDKIAFIGNASSGATIKDGQIASVTFEVIKRADVTLTITDAHLTHKNGERSRPAIGRAWVFQPQRMPEDVNLDWQIDDADLEFVSARLGQKGKDNPADVNKDGIVDIADLVLIRNALYGPANETPTD